MVSVAMTLLPKLKVIGGYGKAVDARILIASMFMIKLIASCMTIRLAQWLAVTMDFLDLYQQ